MTNILICQVVFYCMEIGARDIRHIKRARSRNNVGTPLYLFLILFLLSAASKLTHWINIQTVSFELI